MISSPSFKVKNKVESSKSVKVSRVLIVDDHPATREGLAYRLSLEHDLEVCGEAAELSEALTIATQTDPDVIIVDLGLTRGDGLDLIARLKSRGCRANLLVWSWRSESLYAERALRAGASGYISKSESTSTILSAIRRVLGGELYLTAELTSRILRRTVGGHDREIAPDSLDDLSNRELEVFRLTGQGMDTTQVAEQLKVSPKTVETYKARIKEKLGLESGGEMLFRAMRWVIENG